MTDLNANLEFGFLSSLVSIHFPGASILFVVGTGPIPPNDPLSIIVSDPVGVVLPSAETEFTLVNATEPVGPVKADETSPVYCGASVTYEGVTFNWLVVPASQALSLKFSFTPPDQTQYGFIYAVVVSRPNPSSFTTNTFQVPVPADPATLYSIYEVKFSGSGGLDFVPAYAYTIPSVQATNLGITTPVPTGPDLNLSLQQEGMMGPGGLSAASFVVAYDPATKALTITPDQGFYD